MIFYLQTINLVYALGGLLLLGVTLVSAYDYYFNASLWYERYVANYAWLILLVVTWSGVATTLLYSEGFGFVPCSLCWLQRIALYPQALLGIVAYRVRDSVYFPIYGIVLSAFGFVVAVYQYIYQMMPKETIATGVMPCLADGTADCGTKVMEVFGFVTFPFLSAVTFVFLIVLYLHIRRSQKLAQR
jgi:disulfide bond formation protein DsbB